MNLRRFYIPPETVLGPQPELTGSEAGHICRVLRMHIGDAVELFDGTGFGYRARIVSLSPKGVRLAVEDRFVLNSESAVRITLAQAMLKDRKMDDLVSPLTELGIDCWMPFYAARCVPVARSKGMKSRISRWEKIALEAVKQCRRGRVPQIVPEDSLDGVLAAGARYDLRIVFWEDTPRAFHISDVSSQAPQRIMLVVGPEGGFDEDEIRRAKASGFLTTGLGPRILRAQTAALAATTLVQYCFGDMGPTP